MSQKASASSTNQTFLEGNNVSETSITVQRRKKKRSLKEKQVVVQVDNLLEQKLLALVT